MSQPRRRSDEKEFLHEIVRAAGYELNDLVSPQEVGTRLGLNPTQVAHCVRYWVACNRFEHVSDDYVSISVEALNDVDGWEAEALFYQLREQFLQSGADVVQLVPEQESRPRFERLLERLEDEGWLQDWGGDHWCITDAAKRRMRGTEPVGHSGLPIVHYHVEIKQGPMNKVTITNSSVGALAFGEGSVATVTNGMTQDEFKAEIDQVLLALVRDQDALAGIDQRLYEALSQFLRMTRQTQVGVESVADVQRKMKETLDEIRATQFADELRPQVLPKVLEVAKVLLSSPIFAEVAKHLVAVP